MHFNDMAFSERIILGARTCPSIGVHLKLSREIKHYTHTNSYAKIFYTDIKKDDMISYSEISRFHCTLLFSLIHLIVDIK